MKRRHSISGRLLFLFLFTAFLLALVVRTGFQFGFQGNFRDVARPHVAEYIQYLLNEIGDPPSTENAEQLARRLPLEIHFTSPIRWSSDGVTPPRFDSDHAHRKTLPNGTPMRLYRKRGQFVVEVIRNDQTILLIPEGLETSDAAPIVVMLTIFGVLAVLAFAYHGIRRIFNPIKTIQQGVTRIGDGELNRRLEIKRRDELGELAESINHMADDIRDMLEAKRGLLLAVSHELRSPLTRARVNAELLEDKSGREALLKDLGELENLLSELLESERLQGRHSTLERQAVDPTELINELVQEEFPDQPVGLQLDPAGTWLSLDPVRIRLLVRNLLRNAIAHTQEGKSPPKILSRVDDAQWLLEVSDQGPGIAPEHIEHLTEPFYRADPSRQRGSGGFGLGLYLCRIIAEAHGGSLNIKSKINQGSQIRVGIPLKSA